MAGASIPVIRQRAIGDGRIKLLILTGNALKKREYDSIFSVYGVKITYSEDVVARNDPENEAAVTALFAKQKPSPHYILRERSKLVDAVSGILSPNLTISLRTVVVTSEAFVEIFYSSNYE